MPKSCAVVKKIFLLIDEQIINMVCNSQGEKEAEDTDDVASMISHYDGLKSIDGALPYIKQQQECLPHHILTVQRWHNIASSKRGQKLRQKTISLFRRKLCLQSLDDV